MKTSTRLLALAGVAGALTLAGCVPAYDRSYGYGGNSGYGYSGYGNAYNSYDSTAPRYRTYETPRYTNETPRYTNERRYDHDDGDRRSWRHRHGERDDD